MLHQHLDEATDELRPAVEMDELVVPGTTRDPGPEGPSASSCSCDRGWADLVDEDLHPLPDPGPVAFEADALLECRAAR